MVPLAPRKKMMGRYQNSKRLLPLTPQEQQSSSRIGKPVQELTRSSSNNNNNSGMPNTGWRRYGIERRRQLLEQDELQGGNIFHLNYQCRIQGYFALSEKVRSLTERALVLLNDGRLTRYLDLPPTTY